jgi:hypothetical protein
MDRINMNEFAVTVALEEEGEVEINIAEIKQILRITLEKLGGFDDEQILELVERYKE